MADLDGIDDAAFLSAGWVFPVAADIPVPPRAIADEPR
jgi:hypothetical protein